MSEYSLTSPCDTCPFRNDIRPFIRPERVREIEASLVRAVFPCHKTVDYSAEDGESRDEAGEIHCAGALILLEKEDRPSQMMRICERLGMYDRTKLKMDAPVYDSFDEMYEAHLSVGRPKRKRRPLPRARA